MNDLAEIEPFAELRVQIGSVSFPETRPFRLSADMQIIAAMRGLIRSRAAQDAAAVAARDCGELAADIAQGGSTPSAAWEEAIHVDRERALSSVKRLAALLADCDRINGRDGFPSDRSGSVPMRKKPYYQRENKGG